MCEPTTLMAAGLAISALSAGVTYKQTSDAAKVQTESIRQSAEMQNIQTAQTYDQQNQQAMEQTSQRHQEWLRDLGRLRAVGAESGLTGATDQRIQNEAETQAQNDIATIEANRLKSNLNTATTGVAQGRQANAALKSIKQPSLVGTGLQIAGAATSAYSDYKKTVK